MLSILSPFGWGEDSSFGVFSQASKTAANPAGGVVRHVVAIHARIGHPRKQPQAGMRGFMLLEWMGNEVGGIRDFRYASYCVKGADIRELG